jgi:hypothetical protein
MSTSPQALVKGIVSRTLPDPNPDGFNNDVAMRLGTYGELTVQPVIRKQHVLADEGAYYILHNNQTAIAPPTATAFVATTPTMVITNLDPSKRMYIDYISLTVVTAFTAASGTGPMYGAIVLDNTATGRYTSGGTQITNPPVSPNMSLTTNAQLNAYFGAITAPAASAAARTIVGQKVLRPAASGTAVTVIGDTILMNAGGVEGAVGSTITLTNPNIIPVPIPPIILAPTQTFLLYTYQAATTPVAGTILPEVGFWLR